MSKVKEERLPLKKCTLDSANTCLHRIQALNTGLEDATLFPKDLLVSDLVDQWLIRDQIGYCPQCTHAYIEGVLIKLKYIAMKKRGV